MTPAIDADPVDPPDRWLHHMRHGEWDRAWALSDALLPARAREPCSHLPRHLQYVWTGAPLQGKRVLVRCYHGLGDTIQFIRYAPLLRAIAAEVTVWAQPGLLPLLATVDGIDRLLPLHDGTPDADYDVDVEIMELPHIFRTTPDNVPARTPYLQAAPMPLQPATGRPAVGLVWRAGDWDEQRSIPFHLLEAFASLPAVTIYILQPGARAAGWSGQFGEYPGELALPAYARAIRAMDLLVSIDSMPAHLAGAVGTPVWTMLHTGCDWRWMQHRTETPWYPGMRLFRQRTAGDWQPVLDEVVDRLRGLRRGGPRQLATGNCEARIPGPVVSEDHHLGSLSVALRRGRVPASDCEVDAAIGRDVRGRHAFVRSRYASEVRGCPDRIAPISGDEPR